MWRRIHLIPFNVTIPEGERDKHLPQKLEAELPGILVWAVDGFGMWQQLGLRPPKEVQAATEEYRQDMDHVGQWIADKCDTGADVQATAASLFASYDLWREATRAPRLTQNKLGRELGRRGFTKVSQPERGWRGIALAKVAAAL